MLSLLNKWLSNENRPAESVATPVPIIEPEGVEITPDDIPELSAEAAENAAEVARQNEVSSHWPSISPELQAVFQSALQQFHDCKAIACVDILQNSLLAIETRTHLPSPVMSLVAAATTDLFTAPNMLKVAEIFRSQQKDYDKLTNFDEIIVNGDGTVYLLLRLMHKPNVVCVFSCQNDGNTLGMLLHQARALLPTIAEKLS